MPQDLPKLYAHIFRNMVKAKPESNVLSEDEALWAIRKVVRRAPNSILRGIITEMIVNYAVLRPLNPNWIKSKKFTSSRFLVVLNGRTKTQLRRLERFQDGAKEDSDFPIKI